MKKLDIGGLFSIFSANDDEVLKEHGVVDYSNSPIILFGRVVRGVENFYIIDMLYTSRYGERYAEVQDNIKLLYFLDLMKHFESLKDLTSDTISSIEDQLGITAIDYALQEMIDFFLSLEYYEQCAVLKKYLDFFSLKKLV